MNFRPRLIPAVIVAATLLLGVKVSDIFGGAGHALAQAPSPNGPATSAPVDLTKQANAASAPAASQSAPSQANAAQPNQPTPAASASASPSANGAPTPSSTGATSTQTAEAPATGAAAKEPLKDPLLLSPAEIEILQELSQRRAELDKRASALDQQQVVLQAAEKRVDDKITKLQELQKSIQLQVNQQNAAEDARMQSLVKIYETMKPADAAQILSSLDMPILLQMLSHMKEAKTAPILAAMDPTKAEAITTAMAQRQINPVAAGK
jgi:flagellar motility protein MotE (MotC chaperone)